MSMTYGSRKGRFVGQSIIYPVPIPLEASRYAGACIVAQDGQFYYSDGFDWVIPTGDVEISRPSARIPTTTTEQTQLRLSVFRSPAGLTQGGILFQISTDGETFDAPTEHMVTSETANLYQLLYPDDGFAPGDKIFWRALYFATDGTQSDVSVPVRQVFPELIDDPRPVTREGAVTGTVELTPFFSPFGLDHVETQIQFFETDRNPETDTPAAEVSSIAGAVIPLPEALTEGQDYIWRGRYGGRAGGAGPILHTQWSTPRFILKGISSMILVYDPALALNRTINLPMGVHGGVVNVNVDWGDGTSATHTSGGIRSRTYGSEVTGPVTVIISGQLGQFGGNTNIQGLVRVDNIGVGLGLTSLREMFRNVTSNTIFCTPNIPPTVRSVRGMFRGDADPGFAVQDLIVSDVEDFSECFEDNGVFNQPLAGWDTSGARTMSRMFFATTSGKTLPFNQPLGSWDVSKVTDMSFMFGAAVTDAVQLFNQNIGAWNVSGVRNFEQMFGCINTGGARNGSIAFNNGGSGSIRNWNTSSATNMRAMFSRARTGTTSFNQPLDGWDVSGVTSFERMFDRAPFNASLAGWNISSATTVAHMFEGAAFNNDVSNWVLPTNISELFRNALQFNHPSILTWDTSGVVNMASLFERALAFNQPIGVWDVSNVTTMSAMFRQLRDDMAAFNQPLNAWTTSSLTECSRMFEVSGSNGTGGNRVQGYNQPLGSWDVSKVTDMSFMFGATGSTEARPTVHRFDQDDIAGWHLNPAGVNMQGMFFAITDDRGISQTTYARIVSGWANTVAAQNGPFNVSLGAENQRYNADAQFPGTLYPDAVAGRAYLTALNRLTVSDAGNPDANGDYLFNAGLQLYVNANGWFFIKESGVWVLKDSSEVTQATQQEAGDLSAPQLVETWSGALASATVQRTGAAWTIADGGLQQ